jgi:hypothetical protein
MRQDGIEKCSRTLATSELQAAASAYCLVCLASTRTTTLQPCNDECNLQPFRSSFLLLFVPPIFVPVTIPFRTTEFSLLFRYRYLLTFIHSYSFIIQFVRTQTAIKSRKIKVITELQIQQVLIRILKEHSIYKVTIYKSSEVNR